MFIAMHHTAGAKVHEPFISVVAQSGLVDFIELAG
jgi:hypothetical protein